MKNKETQTKSKGGQKELYYYIIYQYNVDKNDIEYITSKKDLISAINCVNGYLLANGDTINIIKDIEKIIKNRNINKYITLDIDNLKVINQFVIYKQFISEKVNKKYILDKLEKQAKNNTIEVNKIYKKEVVRYKKHYQKLYGTLKVKKLNEKETFKKLMEIKLKIKDNVMKKHENKNIILGGALYE